MNIGISLGKVIMVQASFRLFFNNLRLFGIFCLFILFLKNKNKSLSAYGKLKHYNNLGEPAENPPPPNTKK